MLHCKACKLVKNDDDFYVSNRTTCKECIKKAVRENRAKRIDYYREYDRNRAMRADRVAAREAYQKTEAGKAATARAHRRFVLANPLKRKAQIAVGNALRDGKLKRNPCEACGTARAQAHHDDYGKPLEVRWLCAKHHAEWHKANDPVVPDQSAA